MGTVGIVLIISLVISLLIRIPVAFSLGIASLAALLVKDIPLLVIAQKIMINLDSFTLMAIPFFVFAGQLMNQAGITKRIIDFSNSIVGRYRGGLSLTNIIASMIFGGVSGSMIADTTALGTILIPSMIEEGYDPDFSAAVTASSSLCGPIIPPSIPMVVYGATAGVSVLDLFLGGIIPGIMIGVFLIIYCFIISNKRKYPKMPKQNIIQIIKSFLRSFFALLMPVIMIGGLLVGLFTPTEAAAVAAVYAIIVGLFIYREINFQNFLDSLIKSFKITAQVLIMISFAKLFAWVLIANNIPQLLTGFLLSLTNNPLIILLILNILMLFMGCFMGPLANMAILIPLVMSTIKAVGIDPLHFGIIMTFNLSLGLLTPPFGLSLFISSSIAKISFKRIVIATLPFLLILLVLLLTINLFPVTVTFIPNLGK